ncbi:hypothetical protein PMIN01_02541 [Paraphaeosphaeria minitans]|uniref:Uncharacterized protein n=1 Tax=Paraphaeosphaeria minitans TaxID=565426 RepID=A0A9P6GR74_9PLEO|nr:hypothetical protein PMIN01_02541 [Paraphaeosphaeria minitans]
MRVTMEEIQVRVPCMYLCDPVDAVPGLILVHGAWMGADDAGRQSHNRRVLCTHAQPNMAADASVMRAGLPNPMQCNPTLPAFCPSLPPSLPRMSALGPVRFLRYLHFLADSHLKPMFGCRSLGRSVIITCSASLAVPIPFALSHRPSIRPSLCPTPSMQCLV